MCLFKKQEQKEQFCAGEKVRILYNKYNGYGNRYIGEIKTIEKNVALDTYTIVEDDYPNKVWFLSDALQKVSDEELATIKMYEKLKKVKTKNKSICVKYFENYKTLKIGDIVTLRDGRKFPINVNNKILISNSQYCEDKWSADELCIIKVERPIEYKIIFEIKNRKGKI